MGDFVRRWRRWFLSAMDPQHLPGGWSIDHWDMQPLLHPEPLTTTGKMGKYRPLLLDELVAHDADYIPGNSQDETDHVGPAEL